LAKQNPIVIYALVVMVVALSVAYFGGIKFPFAVTGTEKEVISSNGGELPVAPCDTTQPVSLTYSIFDETPGNESASLSSDYNVNIYVDGVFLQETTAGTAVDVPAGKTVTIYAEDVDSTHDVYGFSDSFQSGCNGILPKSVTKGMQDGSLTLTVYDISGGTDTANAAGSETAIGACGTIDSKLNIRETTRNARWGTNE